MIARFLYALPAFSGMITADDIDKINAVFCKTEKWVLTNTVTSVEEICESAVRKLFKAMTGCYLNNMAIQYTDPDEIT